MSFKNILILVFAGVMGMIFASIELMYISYTNSEIYLRTQFAAQQKDNEVIYDKVWKILQQKVGILDKFSDDFKSVYATMFDERYQGDNSGQSPAFKWIVEHNPSFTPEMYKDLSTAVEVYRGEFARVQRRLLDIKREHDNISLKIPGCWVVGKKPPLEITIITSTKTDMTFPTDK